MNVYRITFDLSTFLYNCAVVVTMEAPADVANVYIEQVALDRISKRFSKGWDKEPIEIISIEDLGVGTDRKTLPLVNEGLWE